MAKKSIQINTYKRVKKKRKGIHSKKKNSRCKSSKNYRKKYRGQGR